MFGSALHVRNFNVTSHQIGMNNGKGKERMLDDTTSANVEQTSAAGPPSSNTFLDRVIASTTGLASSVLAAPSSHEVNESASAARSSAGKGRQSYSNASSTWSEGSGSAVQRQGRSNPPASFRSTHADEHIASAEAEFSSFLDDVPALDTPASTIWSLDDTTHGSTHPQTDAGLPSEERTSTRLSSQGGEDGQDVIKILADPEASIIVNEEVKDEPVVWTMTKGQRAEWQQRLEHDFPQDSYQPRIPYRPNLNLNAREESFDMAWIWGGDSVPVERQHTLKYQFMWLRQWKGVLDHYRDEVWGDLLPLVKEARQEVEQLKDAPEGVTEDGSKALRRLAQLLGHTNQT